MAQRLLYFLLSPALASSWIKKCCLLITLDALPVLFLLAAAFDQTDPDDGNHDDSGARLGYQPDRLLQRGTVLAGAYDVHLRQLQSSPQRCSKADRP